MCMTAHRKLRSISRSWWTKRLRFRDRDDIRLGVHGVRNRSGSQEGQFGNNCTHRNRFHRRSQHFGRRSIHRSLHEPRRGIRPISRQLVMGKPLGLLGRTFDRWWPCWSHLRIHLHFQLPRATPNHRLLSQPPPPPPTADAAATAATSFLFFLIWCIWFC